MLCIICIILVKWRVRQWRSWLNHCATSLKVYGLIAAVVIELTYYFQPQFRPANALACKRNRCQEQLLTREGSRYVWLTTLPTLCASYLENLAGPECSTPRGSSKSVQGFLYLFLRIEDVMDLLYVGKEIGQMKFIEGFYSIDGPPKNSYVRS
jgi:hypothetical protein